VSKWKQEYKLELEKGGWLRMIKRVEISSVTVFFFFLDSVQWRPSFNLILDVRPGTSLSPHGQGRWRAIGAYLVLPVHGGAAQREGSSFART
jgi:hypothetical protein